MKWTNKVRRYTTNLLNKELFGLIKVREGSCEDKYGLPLIRTSGWDYYDPSQISNNKEGDDKNEC